MIPDITKQAAFITGRILHQGTRLPIVGKIRITAREVEIIDKVFEDGTFVVSAPLDIIFPKLSTLSYSIDLTIQADSTQFRQRTVQYSQSISIPAGSNFDPDPDPNVVPPIKPDPLIDLGTIYLPVNPADDPSADLKVYQNNLLVNIRGKVIQAKHPGVPFVTPPTIQVISTGIALVPETADGDGQYKFNEVLVRSPARIKCSPPGFKPIDRPLIVDYGKVFNQEDFRLMPLP
jgi:hypothetical protein